MTEILFSFDFEEVILKILYVITLGCFIICFVFFLFLVGVMVKSIFCSTVVEGLTICQRKMIFIQLSVSFSGLSSEQTNITMNDEPPSYPNSPQILLSHSSNPVQETPPPHYNDWFKNDIFEQAMRNINQRNGSNII